MRFIFYFLFLTLKQFNHTYFEFPTNFLLSPTLHSIPIAPINTDKLVPPAEINGIGIPVGGMLPINISYCIKK